MLLFIYLHCWDTGSFNFDGFSGVSVVAKFGGCCKFCFPLFYTHYHTHTYLSGDGSSLIAKNTGQRDTQDEEYNGAPSVLNIKLMLHGLFKNWPGSHSLV